MKKYFSKVEKLAEAFLHMHGIVFLSLCCMISFFEEYAGILLVLFLCEMSRREGRILFSLTAILLAALLSVGSLFLFLGVMAYLAQSLFFRKRLSFRTYLAAFLFLLFPLWEYGILCFFQKNPHISLMQWMAAHFALLFLNVEFSMECLLRLLQNPHGDFSFVSFLFF